MAKGFFKEKFEDTRDAWTVQGIRKPKNDYDLALTRSSEENKEIFVSYEKLQNQIKEQIKNAKPEEMTSAALKRMSEKLADYEKKSGAIMDAEQRSAQAFDDILYNKDKKTNLADQILTRENTQILTENTMDDIKASMRKPEQSDPVNSEQEDALRENSLLNNAQARAEKSKKSAEEARIVAEKEAQNLEEVRRRIQGLGPEKKEAE